MTKSYFDLTLDGDAFTGLKHDFNSMLERTINTMQMKDVNSASIVLKLEIEFPEGKLDDNSGFLFPMFKHKVSAAMQFKDEKTGYFGGADFKLIWDRTKKCWEMVAMDSDQMSFDYDYSYEYDTEED